MYNEKIDEIIYLLKNNSISDFIASLSLIVAIIAVIVMIVINVRENKNILIWLADKSVDLAIAYLPIITNSLNW